MKESVEVIKMVIIIVNDNCLETDYDDVISTEFFIDSRLLAIINFCLQHRRRRTRHRLSAFDTTSMDSSGNRWETKNWLEMETNGTVGTRQPYMLSDTFKHRKNIGNSHSVHQVIPF